MSATNGPGIRRLTFGQATMIARVAMATTKAQGLTESKART